MTDRRQTTLKVHLASGQVSLWAYTFADSQDK